MRPRRAGRCSMRELRPRSRCPCRRPARCGSRSSRPSARATASRASRRSDPRMRSNGCGMPTRPPCSRAAAIVSAAVMPGRMADREIGADEIAVGGLDLLADDDRQAGRRRVASGERAIDPIVVRDDQVRQAPRRGRSDDIARLRQAIEARGRMTVQVDERPVGGHRSARFPAASGRRCPQPARRTEFAVGRRRRRLDAATRIHPIANLRSVAPGTS